MDEVTQDILDVTSKLVTVIAALYGVIFGLRQYAQSRAQRRIEHRWTQAEKAKTLIDEMFDNPKACAALKILTWRKGQMYEISSGKKEFIDRQMVITALSSRSGSLTIQEKCFVQECFEALLWHINYIEHFIQVDLIRFSDVMPPLKWAIERLAAKDIQPLVRAYSHSEGFMFTEMFCTRFDASVWPRSGYVAV